jgi:hypothetical protein
MSNKKRANKLFFIYIFYAAMIYFARLQFEVFVLFFLGVTVRSIDLKALEKIKKDGILAYSSNDSMDSS